MTPESLDDVSVVSSVSGITNSSFGSNVIPGVRTIEITKRDVFNCTVAAMFVFAVMTTLFGLLEVNRITARSIASDVVRSVGDSSSDEFVLTVSDPLSKFRDVSNYPPQTDLPFVWVIPGADTQSFQYVMKQCYGLTSMKDLGVDTSTLEGLRLMRERNLVSDKRADYFFSPFLVAAARSLTGGSRHGRLIVSFQHPNMREFNLFYRLKSLGHPAYFDMSFADYLDSDLIVTNWMTRLLLKKKLDEEITLEDVTNAKGLLRKKALVLLAEDKLESLKRLERYFRWTTTTNDGALSDCITKSLEVSKIKLDEDPDLYRGSPEWATSSKLNEYDVMLFEYVQELFEKQGAEIYMDPPFGNQ
eukprot:CAMPEP_0195507170 /NCGR_PEP_ID=MMETSP0794_2-20130614/679_1 /TAXON_ID=515487 /ORGANISM="Stephanopyxis turris, Strain CCMP 815" /LENGTH=358 /DNA_ID=CAMNT_0040633763 /DNA_START=90 /DNA_END=1166 /DNA_ORIENTATION=+